MTEDQLTLQDSLLRRVGELQSHLCRYDVYLRCLVSLLTHEPVLREDTEAGSIEARLQTLGRLMRARTLPDKLRASFASISEEMLPILRRHAIGALNPVLKAHIDIALPPDLSDAQPHMYSWLDPPLSPTAPEMAAALACIERDIVAAALGLNLLHQFWLHAPWLPTLGPLEWVLNTPAH